MAYDGLINADHYIATRSKRLYMEREQLVETWFANIQSLQKAWKSRFHGELIGQHMTIAQLGVLLYIQGRQPVSSKQIATEFGITKSAVAQFLDGLDQVGLITREHDPGDRRFVYVGLSPAGEAQAQALHDRRKAFFTKLADVMTDEEMRTMIRVQQKMVRQIEDAIGKESKEDCVTDAADGHEQRQTGEERQ
jgi:DNA-binding MarR family transcriptional regulator